eukprot:SAG22_NODE_697_length_7825_cov_8.757831_4_plen_164_part_00
MATDDVVLGLQRLDKRLAGIESFAGGYQTPAGAAVAAVAHTSVVGGASSTPVRAALAAANSAPSEGAPEAAQVSARDDFVAGAVAGFVVKALEYPFDTLKVRLQTQGASGGGMGPMAMLTQTVRKEGVRALYKGVRARSEKLGYCWVPCDTRRKHRHALVGGL